MTITVEFTAHRTVRIVCGDEMLEVALPDAPARPGSPARAVGTGASASTRSPDAARPVARPSVIGVVQGERHGVGLAADVYARVVDQRVAESPVLLDDIGDFNVTNLSFRALEDDVRDAADATTQPLVLDVLVDPAGLDREIALERLRRIVNDRSNPIDAIRLLDAIGSP